MTCKFHHVLVTNNQDCGTFGYARSDPVSANGWNNTESNHERNDC